MALSAKVVTFLLPDGAAGTTLAVTGVGFTPKAIIFFWGGNASATDSTVSETIRFGVGFGASPTDRRCVANYSLDAAGTSDTQTAQREDACIASSSGSAVTGLWDLQSMDADGFTIVVDLDPPAADVDRVSALCIGGDDVTNVAGDSFAPSGATGNQDITSVGFQPDIVFLLTCGSITGIPTSDVTARLSLGAAVAVAQQGVLTVVSENGAGTMNTQRYCKNDEFLLISSSAPAISGRADFVAMLSDGFRINWSVLATATRIVEYFAIKGGSWRVGGANTATSLTTIVESGFGFTPKGVFVASTGAAESSPGTMDSHLALSLGAGDSPTSRYAHGDNDPDALGTSNTWTGIEYDEVYTDLVGNGGVVGLMDIQSFDSDGITFVMDDADPTAKFVWYVACGDTAAAAALPPNSLMLLGVGL